jgi:hypothetical protein
MQGCRPVVVADQATAVNRVHKGAGSEAQYAWSNEMEASNRQKSRSAHSDHETLRHVAGKTSATKL